MIKVNIKKHYSPLWFDMKHITEELSWLDEMVARQQEIARTKGLVPQPEPKVIERTTKGEKAVQTNIPTTYGFDGEVQMAKELVKAAHGLNIHELRLIRYAVSKIHATAPQPPQLSIKIPAIAYAEVMDVKDSKHFYRDLEKAADGLWKKQIRIRRDTVKGEVIETIGWLSYSKYQRGEGWIELRFTAEVTPLLSALKDESRIIYQLQNLIDLRSVYSARLFELLMQWKDSKRLLITLEDYRHAMEIPNTYRYTDIRAHCIIKPIQELLEHCKIEIQFIPHKDKLNKRQVSLLEFIWKPVEQIEIPLEGGETPKKKRGRKPKEA